MPERYEYSKVFKALMARLRAHYGRAWMNYADDIKIEEIKWYHDLKDPSFDELKDSFDELKDALDFVKLRFKEPPTLDQFKEVIKNLPLHKECPDYFPYESLEINHQKPKRDISVGLSHLEKIKEALKSS